MRKTTKLGKAPAIRAALGTAAALALAFALTGCDNPGGAPWTPVWMPPGPGLWVYGADAPVTGHAAVGSASVIANAINHAIAPANAGTRFVLAVGGNASMSSGFTMAAGTDLTIVSLTPGRAFNFSGTSGRLFTVGNGATLRLGNGLDVGGRAGHPNELIRVNSGGTLIMTGNSQITGHRNIGATTLANGLGAAVHVAHGGTLTMYGSSRIQANRAEGTHPNTNRVAAFPWSARST